MPRTKPICLDFYADGPDVLDARDSRLERDRCGFASRLADGRPGYGRYQSLIAAHCWCPPGPGADPRWAMGPNRFTTRPDLAFTWTNTKLPEDDHLLPERTTTRMTDPLDDHRGNSGAPLVPGMRSLRDEPSVESSQSPLSIVLSADSWWLKVSVTASHRPSGEQAGQIQLRV
jgi:hypothetical protein